MGKGAQLNRAPALRIERNLEWPCRYIRSEMINFQFYRPYLLYHTSIAKPISPATKFVVFSHCVPAYSLRVKTSQQHALNNF
jgi:hypothetical protein